jgi:uncharacterized protein YkwD
MAAMGRGRILSLAIGACAVAAGAIAAPTLANDAPANPFAYRLLAAHNDERVASGVPPLAWSDDLAGQARQWAEHLAQQGQMIHATREQRGNAGENLWMGAAGRYSAEYMVGAFIEEKRNFRNGTFPDVSKTGQWRDVGHYTQVIWRGTQQVGCAVAKNRTNDFLVCRYFPAGNWYGQSAL